MRKITVIAHRGAAKCAPQNTMPAFIKAAELGADGIETDVHITGDGKLVLCHNSKVNKTSNGSGKISSLSLQELKKLDFGSWFGKKYVGTQIPTLDEFMQNLKNSCIDTFHIEIKPIKSKRAEVVKKVLETAKKYNLTEKIFITSFDAKVLKAVKEFNKNCRTGYLCPSIGNIVKNIFISPLKKAKEISADAVIPQSSYIGKRFIKKAHSAGLNVYAWTVNKKNLAVKLINMGVDGIITDVPKEIKECLATGIN